MKKLKKAIKIYFITFIICTFVFFLSFTLGLENNKRGGTYISGALHPKTLYEVWQCRYAIFFESLGLTLVIGSAFYYVDRNNN